MELLCPKNLQRFDCLKTKRYLQSLKKKNWNIRYNLVHNHWYGIPQSHMILFWTYFSIFKIKNINFIWKIKLKKSIFLKGHWLALSWFTFAAWWVRDTVPHWGYLSPLHFSLGPCRCLDRRRSSVTFVFLLLWGISPCYRLLRLESVRFQTQTNAKHLQNWNTVATIICLLISIHIIYLHFEWINPCQRK